MTTPNILFDYNYHFYYRILPEYIKRYVYCLWPTCLVLNGIWNRGLYNNNSKVYTWQKLFLSCYLPFILLCFRINSVYGAYYNKRMALFIFLLAFTLWFVSQYATPLIRLFNIERGKSISICTRVGCYALLLGSKSKVLWFYLDDLFFIL